MHLVIPSAKLVNEELQSIGKLPGIIYPVNKRIVFDYLFDQYDGIVNSINVVCYENADKVHHRLSNYSTDKINVIDLSELGDLGYSVYVGLSDCSGPVIINFGDTIVLENDSILGLDSFYYSTDYQSDVWTYFDLVDGVLCNIHDKIKSKIENNKREKLFVGVFSFSDCSLLKKCLEESFDNRDTSLSSFYQAIKLYSTIKPLNAVYTDKWFDIGHQDKYFNSTLEVRAREFNHIVIDKDRGILRKYSDNVDKFIGEIKWYLKLPTDIEYVRPRIFDYSTSYVDPFVSMEYYSYHTLHELYLYGDLTQKQWLDIFSRIEFVCKDFKRYSVKDNKIVNSLDDMYLKKTIQRFDILRKNESFENFFIKPITVNKARYLSLDDVISVLKNVVPRMLYDVDSFSIIHGDMCFANIMVDSNFSFIKLIDPRGKFGDYDIYGDTRYELAKLFHSIDGKYDYIIKDLFNVSYDLKECSIDYSIIDRPRDFDLYQLFVQSFSDDIGDDLKKIELIEALLFLSMIPLHNESVIHQLAMLGTGLDILNRVVNISI